MTRDEQQRRRALKAERKELQRQVTARTVPVYYDESTRRSYMRRMADNLRATAAAYRDAKFRIGDIDRELRGAA